MGMLSVVCRKAHVGLTTITGNGLFVCPPDLLHIMNRNITFFLCASVLLNVVLGYSFFLEKESKKDDGLAMDMKCATFLPDLKKQEKSEINNESISSVDFEVFFSPAKKACLSLEKVFMYDNKSQIAHKAWSVKNLFTNETIISQAWQIEAGTVTVTETEKYMINEIAELKKES